MSMEKALALAITAFEKVKPSSAKKRETLALCFEQIKKILKEYMKENNIQLIQVDLKTKNALVVEPIPNAIKQAFIDQWLKGELSTKRFKELLSSKFQNSYYLDFTDFLQEVEFWLSKKGKVSCHG